MASLYDYFIFGKQLVRKKYEIPVRLFSMFSQKKTRI
jgi:hypothetical protein